MVFDEANILHIFAIHKIGIRTMKRLYTTIKRWLSGLSFKTGVIVLAICVLLYILSFAQMLLPISNSAKFTLWVILFGLAKATQYTGLAIVGVEGWRRIKRRLKRKREDKERE